MVDKSIIDIAKKYIELITQNFDLRKAYLFGSYATHNADENSDIDIAIILGKIDDFFLVQLELMRLRRNIDLRIEPHPFENNDFINSNPFVKQIITKGIEL